MFYISKSQPSTLTPFPICLCVIFVVVGCFVSFQSEAADEYLLYDDPILILEVVKYGDLGRKYVEQKEFEKAIEAYTKALEYPENSMTQSLLFLRGAAYLKIQNYEAARQDFEQGIVVDPTEPFGHYSLALFYWEIHQWEKVIDHFTIAIQLGLHKRYEIDEANSYYMRGYSYAQIGEYEKGLADLTKAIELGYRPSELYHTRGYIYESLGRYSEAERDYSISLEGEPGNRLSLFGRATVLKCLGRPEQAIRDFTEILKNNPEDKEARLQRGATYVEIDEYAAAFKDLYNGPAQYLDHPFAALMVAEAFIQMGKLSQALEANSEALKQEVPDVQVAGNFQRGFLFLHKGHISQARAAYQEALRLNKSLDKPERRVEEELRQLHNTTFPDPQVAKAKTEIMSQLKQVYNPPPEVLKEGMGGCQYPSVR